MGKKQSSSLYDQKVKLIVRREWDKFQSQSGWNQKKAGELLGMNQSAFSQYVNTRNTKTKLNTDFLLKFSKLIGVNPSIFSEQLPNIPPEK